MKLSQLVAYRTYLDTFPLLNIKSSINSKVNKVNDNVTTISQLLVDDQQQIIASLEAFKQQLLEFTKIQYPKVEYNYLVKALPMSPVSRQLEFETQKILSLLEFLTNNQYMLLNKTNLFNEHFAELSHKLQSQPKYLHFSSGVSLLEFKNEIDLSLNSLSTFLENLEKFQDQDSSDEFLDLINESKDLGFTFEKTIKDQVGHRQHLEQVLNVLPFQDLEQQIQNQVNQVIDEITQCFDLQINNIQQLAHELTNDWNNIAAAFDTFETQIEQIKLKVSAQIAEKEKLYFQQSYKFYELQIEINQNYGLSENLREDEVWIGKYGIAKKGINPEKVKHRETVKERIINRRIKLTKDEKTFFTSRILKHTNWQHSGLILHPMSEDFFTAMFGNDPLYLVDESHELLAPVLDTFTSEYRNRVRPYVIQENEHDEILSKIPNSQFGIVVAYNYFNYKPFEVIKKYLQEIYQKLHTGGFLIMTFNECDNEYGVRMVEEATASYTPGGLVKQLALSLGFEIEFEYNKNTFYTWIELKKPGEMTSLRGGQTLAKIIPKPIAQSK
jgi:hypothetical protein